MENIRTYSNNAALILLSAGFFMYVAVDLGLPPGLRSWGTAMDLRAPLSRAQELNRELDEITARVQEEKAKLRKLQEEVAQVEARASGRRLASGGIGQDAHGTPSHRLAQVPVRPASPAALAETLRRRISKSAGVEATRINDREFMRVKTRLGFQSIYLTVVGMRQVRMISQAAAALGYGKIAIAYAKGDRIGKEKALVVSRFLREMESSGPALEVVRLPAEKAASLTNGFELWMERT